MHTNEDLSADGFRRAGAYVRMHADEVPVREREPSFIAERDYAEVLARAYSGLWGHKHVSPLAQPPDDAVVVGVPVVGLCRVWPEQRLIDGPGGAAGGARGGRVRVAASLRVRGARRGPGRSRLVG